MEVTEETEVEIEILWRQWTPEDWQAILTHRATGKQWEVYNERALRHVLEEICQGLSVLE